MRNRSKRFHRFMANSNPLRESKPTLHFNPRHNLPWFRPFPSLHTPSRSKFPHHSLPFKHSRLTRRLTRRRTLYRRIPRRIPMYTRRPNRSSKGTTRPRCTRNPKRSRSSKARWSKARGSHFLDFRHGSEP